jgi:hypothetical protein
MPLIFESAIAARRSYRRKSNASALPLMNKQVRRSTSVGAKARFLHGLSAQNRQGGDPYAGSFE